MPMGKGRCKGRQKAKVRWERCRVGKQCVRLVIQRLSAPHGFSVTGECVHVEPQYWHGIKIHSQTLLLSFSYAHCETSLRPFAEVAVSKLNLRHNDSSQNKATGKGLLEVGRAASVSNYLTVEMCAFVCNEEQASLLLCGYSGEVMCFIRAAQIRRYRHILALWKVR